MMLFNILAVRFQVFVLMWGAELDGKRRESTFSIVQCYLETNDFNQLRNLIIFRAISGNYIRKLFFSSNFMQSVFFRNMKANKNLLVSTINSWPIMAWFDATRLATSTHRTELILMFEKIVIWYIFGIKYQKTLIFKGFRMCYLSIR